MTAKRILMLGAASGAAFSSLRFPATFFGFFFVVTPDPSS
jgi:hypothetical protein